MSTTSNTLNYFIVGGIQANTPGGSSINGAVELSISAASDLTDADIFALQEALVAAFPTGWGIDNSAIPISKQATSLTQYATNYSAVPPSFT